LGLAVFYDGGNVFPRVGFYGFSNNTSRSGNTGSGRTPPLGLGYKNNVGLGLRYATPVGPVRIDVGRNLNPVQGINATQYFITIGQAF
jgi:outer membrane protein assembly factor BamA